MNDNSLRYCTSIAFSAAMTGFGLASISRSSDAEKISGIALLFTASLWITICFGKPILAGIKWLAAACKARSSTPASPLKPRTELESPERPA